MKLKQNLIESLDVARLQWRPFVVTLLVIAGVYLGAALLRPGLATYLLSLPPALVIAVTALARVNDIGPEHMAWRWHVRRTSLVMAGTGAVMVIGAPLTETGYAIPWWGVVLIWGVGGAWLTTPGQPPWEDYITGKYRRPRADGSRPGPLRDFADRVTGRITSEHRVRDLQCGHDEDAP